MNEQTKLLKELVQLARVQVYPVAYRLLESEFFQDGEAQLDRIQVYGHLNGSAQRDVAKAAGVNQSSVSRWSTSWKRKGLVDDEGKAVFDIFDFFPGLEDEIGKK